MKCEIIRDLLPLSGEGLCSEESEKLIAEHIRDCENCRLLYEKIPETETEKPSVPNEEETFKKVNHKFKKMNVKMWIIGILLTALLGCVGYLSFGQITKMQGTRSFETIAQSFEVRKIARYIAEGDFDSYVDSISDGFITDIFKNQDHKLSKEIFKHTLAENFEKSYGSTKVKNINVKTVYGQMFAKDSYVAYSTAEIKFENGQTLLIDFVKNVDGKYITCSPAYFYEADNDEKKFYNALDIANWHEILPLGITEKLILSESTTDMYARRFREEYRETVLDGKKAFLDNGFTVNNAYFSRSRLDADKKMFYYDFTMETADDKGTAVMTTRIYYDYLGMYPPEKDSIKIYTDNCTADLENALYNFFG